MTQRWQISRRTVLRGMGTAVALPLLDAMTPALAIAGGRQKLAPVRMAFVYVPNGMHVPDWTPAAVGSDFELPYITEPLAKVKDRLLVLSGLAQDHGRPHGDGPGDHARALASFLTGAQAKKTHGADIRVGVSVDQVAARKVGQRTKFSSLELGCDRGAQAGNCDSGYSCAYSTNISWRTDTTPQAKEIDPKLAFERLFSNGVDGELRSKREKYQKSVLDFVLEDARDLKARLGAKDQRKLDEYLNSVRELEHRLYGAQLAAALGLPYAFASHFAPRALMEAIEIYRNRFEPSEQIAEPYVMLGFNVCAADTDEEAKSLRTSAIQSFLRLRRGAPGRLPPPIEDFEASLSPAEQRMLNEVASCSAVGSLETVRGKLESFVARTGADELIVVSQIYDHQRRLRSFEIAAEAAV